MVSKCAIIYDVLYIPGGAGFFPSKYLFLIAAFHQYLLHACIEFDMFDWIIFGHYVIADWSVDV